MLVCTTFTVSVSEIKSYGRVPSFYTKTVKQGILQAVSLEHSIKNDMLFVLGKLNLFKLEKGSLPLLPTCMPYQNDYTKISK